MLTIFNRKEVFVTYSVKDQSDAREILRNYGIEFKVKTRSNQRGITPMGGFGQNVSNAAEYRIFVHKKDVPRAKYYLAHQIKKR